MKEIKPVGNKLLVTPIDKKEERLGELIIPGTVNADLSEGCVVAISDEISDKFAIGDIAIFPKNSGVGHYKM